MEFNKIFKNIKNQKLRKIFNEIIKNYDFSELSYEIQLNNYFNVTLFCYFENVIIFNLSELFEIHKIKDPETQRELCEIYKHLYSSNKNLIINENFEDIFIGINTDEDECLIVDFNQVFESYQKYFENVRNYLFIDTTNQYSSLMTTTAEKYAKVLYNIYNKIAGKNLSFETVQHFSELIAKENNINDINNFVIIIEFMDKIHFNKKKFLEIYKFWSMNRSLSIYEFQRLYLVKVLPRNSLYDNIRKEINQTVDIFVQKINLLEKKEKEEKQKILENYQNSNMTDEELMLEFTKLFN